MTLESLGLGPLETKFIPVLGSQHQLVIGETMKHEFVSRRNRNCRVCSFGREKKKLFRIFIVELSPVSLLVPICKGWNFFASCTGLRVTLSAKSAESLKSFTFFCSAILKNPRDQCLITFEKKQTFYLAQGCQSPSGHSYLPPQNTAALESGLSPWKSPIVATFSSQKKHRGCCTPSRNCGWPAPPSICPSIGPRTRSQEFQQQSLNLAIKTGLAAPLSQIFYLV